MTRTLRRGHMNLREKLLDRTDEVFDLTRYGRLEQRKRLLFQSPERARQRTRQDHTPLSPSSAVLSKMQRLSPYCLAKGAEVNAINQRVRLHWSCKISLMTKSSRHTVESMRGDLTRVGD